ncbi:MAG TPA: SPFH domain-containing protein [Candidatus Methanoperedenaceae archaeon]|nr:SPFH domain-containing protein [Candidatus Methanoperedenaceae archaeon]
MPQVIEWMSPSSEDIVWKYPAEDIEWGAQLVVREYEAAVFFRDGKAYDVFSAGRHTLTSMNLPLITGILSKVAGFNKVPFKSTVIYVSLKQFKGKFGGSTQTTELAPLKFFGTYWFKASDPNLFVNEVVGGQNLFDTGALSTFVRGYFNEGMIRLLAKYSINDAFTNIDRVSTEVNARLQQEFKRIGLDLLDVKFEGVETSDEWREKLFWLKQTGQASYVMQMDTAKQVAKELGKSTGGAAIGAGVAIIPPLMYPPPPQYPQQQPQQPAPQAQPVAAAQPAASQIRCPYCGKPGVPQNSKFCPECGTKLKWCPNGHLVAADAKFCAVCGSDIKA